VSLPSVQIHSRFLLVCTDIRTCGTKANTDRLEGSSITDNVFVSVCNTL